MKLIFGLHTCEKAIKEMRCKKARGYDDVPENVLKTFGENGARLTK